MILKTKDEILSWLEKYAHDYQENIKNDAYEFITLHDDINEYLFHEMMKKDALASDYYEKLKQEGHQYILNVK